MILWRRKWQPSPVFLPRESHGQRSLVGYSQSMRSHWSNLALMHLFFLDSSVVKESACNAGDPGLIPGLGRSSGEGKSYALQYSGLENSMECMVHGVAKSQTRLSDFSLHFKLCDHYLKITHKQRKYRNVQTKSNQCSVKIRLQVTTEPHIFH